MMKINRKTKETEISGELKLYGSGENEISTGIGFFDHMLELFSFHSCFDLKLECKGDLEVCGHHTVEDVGIVLGEAFKKSLPADKSIVRYASSHVPMDEVLARAVIDISGRPFLLFEADFDLDKIGNFDTELVLEFFQAFVNNAGILLHLKILYGMNTHHKIEALFKAVAVGLRQAVKPDANRKGPASSKGSL